MENQKANAYLASKIKELEFVVKAHETAPRQRMYRKSNVIRRAHELTGSLKALFSAGLVEYRSDIYVETLEAVDAALAVVGGKRNP